MSSSSAEVTSKIFFSICGPKGSTCCTVLSIWGCLMLVCLGIAMKLQAVALFEDITVQDREGYTAQENIKHAYDNAALGCFTAAGLYLLYLVLSGMLLGLNIFRSTRSRQRSQ